MDLTPRSLGPVVVIFAIVAGLVAAWIGRNLGASFGVQLLILMVVTYSSGWLGILVGRALIQRK
jgi:hypothetical protein